MTRSSILLALKAAMQQRRAELAKQRAAAERAAIAKAWNDRYCYRVLFDPKAERLPGDGMYGFTPRGGNRWMCPECNAVHAPTSCSAFSGLQYPACCSTGEGNRLSHGIRIS